MRNETVTCDECGAEILKGRSVLISGYCDKPIDIDLCCAECARSAFEKLAQNAEELFL